MVYCTGDVYELIMIHIAGPPGQDQARSQPVLHSGYKSIRVALTHQAIHSEHSPAHWHWQTLLCELHMCCGGIKPGRR